MVVVTFTSDIATIVVDKILSPTLLDVAASNVSNGPDMVTVLDASVHVVEDAPTMRRDMLKPLSNAPLDMETTDALSMPSWRITSLDVLNTVPPLAVIV
jgi:hypothetical protein